MRCWRRCRDGLQGWLETFLFLIFLFTFSEKPTGPNRFQAVLTQLVPGSTAQYHTLLREGSGPCWRNHNKCRKWISKPSFTPAANLRSLVLFSGAKERRDAVGSRSQTPSEHLQQPQIRRPLTPDVALSHPNLFIVFNAGQQKHSENLWGTDQIQRVANLHYARLAGWQAVVFHSKTSQSRSLTIIDHLVIILQNLLTRPEHWNYSPIFLLHLIGCFLEVRCNNSKFSF